VAKRRGYEPDWLNSRARPWEPKGIIPDECEVVVETTSLKVLSPSHDLILLMKLNASRGPDYDDMVKLWRMCEFLSPEVVIERFHQAYPFEEFDPHRIDYVRKIVQAAADPE